MRAYLCFQVTDRPKKRTVYEEEEKKIKGKVEIKVNEIE